MINKVKSTGVLAALLLFAFAACRKDITPKTPQPDTDNLALSPEKQAIANVVKSRLDLVTLVSMDVFQDNPQLKKQVISFIHQNRKADKGESISFSNILQSKAPVTKDFTNKFLSEFADRLETGNFAFAERVRKELDLVRKKGKITVVANRITTGTDFSDWDFDYVTMAHIGAYIHFPYSELFETNADPLLHYTHDPLNPQVFETEVFWEEGQEYSSNWVTGNEEWAMQNATFVFLLDDAIAGNHLDRYVLSPCAQGDFLRNLCNNELLSNSLIVDSVPPPPPPPATYNGPLQNNIAPFAHSTITNDKYLLSATIPRIRIKQNVRPGFWNGDNEIYMYRGNARIANPERENFSDAVIDTSMQVHHKKISRSSGRRGWWVDVGAAYSYQWRQEQENNYIAVTYLAHWLTFTDWELNFKTSAGVTWDTTRIPVTVTEPTTGITVTTYRQRGWVPSFSAKADVNGKIKLDTRREKLMGEVNITRASFMANAIGNNFGLGICSNTSASPCERDWAIRSIGNNYEFFWRVNIIY